MIIFYYSRIVHTPIFQSGMTLESQFTITDHLPLNAVTGEINNNRNRIVLSAKTYYVMQMQL